MRIESGVEMNYEIMNENMLEELRTREKLLEHEIEFKALNNFMLRQVLLNEVLELLEVYPNMCATVSIGMLTVFVKSSNEIKKIFRLDSEDKEAIKKFDVSSFKVSFYK